MRVTLWVVALLVLRLNPAPASVPKGVQQQATAFLVSFQLAINELNSRPDAVVTPENQREELLATFFYTDTATVPNVLLPIPLYKAIHAQLPVRGWLSQLPAFFWEGFGYELDTAHVALKSVQTVRNKVFVRLLVPVQLHGLVQATRRRHEFNEDHEFLVSAERQGGTHRNWKIERITGTGQGFRDAQLTVRHLIAYQEKLATLVMQLVFAQTTPEQRADALRQLRDWMPARADSLQFTLKTQSGQIRQASPGDLTRLNLTAELAAACRVERFDMVHTGNFYRDRDGSINGDVITLRGISVWLEGNPTYQTKRTDSVRIAADTPRPTTETVRISNVQLSF
ncbi:MAG: hypothetical protein H7Z72_25555 [Bacteroidetes bacterium]|nr:hypothetical protein [Fibrella sp.]